MRDAGARAVFLITACVILSASFLADFCFKNSGFWRLQQVIFWPALAFCAWLLWNKKLPRFKLSPYSLAVFFIILAALFLRLYKISALPLNHDEAHTTLQSVFLLGNNGFSSYAGMPLASFDGKTPALFTLLAAFCSRFFHEPQIIVRLPAIICGVLTVWLVYPLAKEITGRMTGIISAFLLAVLPWHIIQSRVGVSVILTPLFAVLFFLFFIKGLKKKDYRYLYLSFFILSIGAFWTYTGSQVLVILAVISLVILRKELSWAGLITLAGCIAAFIIPFYPFLARWKEAGFISSQYYHASGTENFFPGIFLRLKDALALLFWQKEQFYLFAHGFPGPIVQFFLLLPLALGLVAAIKNRIISRTLGVWFLGGLFFSICFVNEVADRYFIVIAPAMAILIAYGLGAQKLKKLTVLAAIAASLGVGVYLADYFAYLHKIPLASLKVYSYGSQGAVDFLAGQTDFLRPQAKAAVEWRMSPAQFYFAFSRGRGLSASGKKALMEKIIPCLRQLPDPGTVDYYCLWSPQSRQNDWDAFGCRLYHQFRRSYPDKEPVKIIYYPGGKKAVEIFKLP